MLRIILAFSVFFVAKQTKNPPMEPVLSPVPWLPKNLNQNSENNRPFSNHCKSKVDLGKESMLLKEEQEKRDRYFEIGYDNYYIEDNYPKAEEYFKKGLEIAPKVCDKYSLLDTAVIYKHLGQIYEKQKDYSQAINQYTQELDIYTEIFKDTHPNTAITSNTIGTMYYNQRNYEEAEQYYRQAVYIFKKTLGEEDPATISAIGDLRKIYLLKGTFIAELMGVSIVFMLIFCFFLVKMRILVYPNF